MPGKINLANILAVLAERLEADYENVRKGISADFRVGDSHTDVNYQGYRGFGGYCFPKDLDAFISHLDSVGLSEYSELLRRDREFNEKLLAEQGLTLEDVSVHDSDWIKNKLKKNQGLDFS